MSRPSDPTLGTNLNSVWLEGTVLEEPGAQGPGAPVYRFQIQDHRPQDHEPASVFSVEARPEAFEGVRGRVSAGRQVRIIGRLTQDRQGVRIVGELVEALGQ